MKLFASRDLRYLDLACPSDDDAIDQNQRVVESFNDTKYIMAIPWSTTGWEGKLTTALNSVQRMQTSNDKMNELHLNNINNFLSQLTSQSPGISATLLAAIIMILFITIVVICYCQKDPIVKIIEYQLLSNIASISKGSQSIPDLQNLPSGASTTNIKCINV